MRSSGRSKKAMAERALDPLGWLQDKVEKGVEHSETSTDDAQRLDEAVRALAAAVETSAGSGDEGGD